MGTKVPVSRAGVERRRSVFGRRLRPDQSRRRTYANPVLVTGTPAASFGTCVGGTEYRGDICRAGENDWNGQGTVVSEGGQCGINPGAPDFR